MTSAAKRRANRRNARLSSGPKSVAGRRRSARNALRHGLAVPVTLDPALTPEIEALAREIAGPDADVEVKDLARRVAEAQAEVRRVRTARQDLLSGTLRDPRYRRVLTLAKIARLCGVDPKYASHFPEEIWRQIQDIDLTVRPKGPQKLKTIFVQEGRTLMLLDRYERRALSRRKFAIRALDDARVRSAYTRKSGQVTPVEEALPGPTVPDKPRQKPT